MSNDETYYCEQCLYRSNKKYNFEKHLNTLKHKKQTGVILPPTELFYCKQCNKGYKYHQSLLNHLKTCQIEQTHASSTQQSQLSPHKTIFNVCNCGKSYKSKSGYYKHIKKCKTSSKSVELQQSSMVEQPKNVTQMLEQILEEHKELRENLKTSNTIIHNKNTIIHNKNNFNISMFLNEKCTNAMNLEDFINKIQLTIEDLQYTKQNGYTKGISNIFIKNLVNMDITKRPIHCSDHKRMHFYIKDDDKWEIDDNNKRLNTSIKKISKKQLQTIHEWDIGDTEETHSETQMDDYFKLVRIVTQENSDKNLRCIKRNVGKSIQLN